MFRKNQLVVMSEEALENYGEEYRGIVYRIAQWYDHSVSTRNPNWQSDEHGHPGYDDAGGGQVRLYHLVNKETGEDLNFDLYDWELNAN